MMRLTFDSESFCGYKQITTFWSDFTIAETFGVKAIKDTFNTAFKEWKSNYKYLTELVMVLNWKLWLWHDIGNTELTLLYQSLWEKADGYACEHLKGDELSYFFRTTD